MEVDFRTLPIAIQRQIPISLRSYKNVHELENLPIVIQNMIRYYFEKPFTVSYNSSLDVKPVISKYNDFLSIEDISDLITEYLKNYLLISRRTYPFDPLFGCRLKELVHTKDTQLKKTLLTSEIDNLIKVISIETRSIIDVESIQIIPIAETAAVQYEVIISLLINKTKRGKLNLNIE